MKIARASLPEGFSVVADGQGRGEVVFDVTEDGDKRVSVQVEGDNLIIYPDRSYKHRDLAKRLGRADG